MTLAGLTAAQVVARLRLVPHPEGGYYRETFRDGRHHGGRSHSTAIYFLLGAGDRSAWHRVDATEIWHYYAGDVLELGLSTDGVAADRYRLGPDPVSGEAFQVVVPPGVWQTAESLGAWTLCGCTVAPGFDFAGFEMAPPGFAPAFSA